MHSFGQAVYVSSIVYSENVIFMWCDVFLFEAISIVETRPSKRIKEMQFTQGLKLDPFLEMDVT